MSALLSCLAALITAYIASLMFPRKLNVHDKHVCVPGGSQGLGLAVAVLLAKQGAHVTIMARTQIKLDAAIVEIQNGALSASQKIHAVAVDLSDPESCSKAFDQASSLQSAPVEILISCVGGAGGIMGLLDDLSPEQLRKGMDTNYFATLWPVREASKRMIAAQIKGKVVIVSSLLGFFSIVGYGAYSPAKFALRGLADTLRNELRLYGISVHCYFPGTILSPGYEEEEKTKPKVTKELEGPADGQTPEQCALKLLRGLANGHYVITSDILGSLFRTSMRGTAPYNNIVVDLFWSFVGAIGIPIWRIMSDRQVSQYGKQQMLHQPNTFSGS